MKIKNKLFILLTFSVSLLSGQTNPSTETTPVDDITSKHSLGASFFMLGNVLAKDSPDYYLLTYGYKLNKKNRVFAEFNTWRYSEPLGTYQNSKEHYPGYVRSYGIGVGYQRFIWKGLFSTVQATPFVKQYHNSQEEKTQKGFQLYLQLAVGYRLKLFKNRFYLEPALALKYWPIDSNFPAEFAKIEKGAPKHIVEPSFNFGYKF